MGPARPKQTIRFRLDRAVLGAALGAAVGAAVGIGGLRLLLHLHQSKGDLYGATALLGSVVGALSSLRLCRDCRAPVAQSVAGGLLSLAAILFGWWQLHLPVGAFLLVLAVVVLLVSLLTGFLAEAKRRRRS